MNRRSIDGRAQTGMTLVELLVVISILGVISFALTESIILGLRITEGTGARVSTNNASQALASYFTADAESADQVFANDGGTCAPTPPVPDAYEVFLHFRWTERLSDVSSVEHWVSYALAPATGPEQRVVRWVCDSLSGFAPAERTIGRFSQAPDTGTPSVTVSCDPALPDPDACPDFDLAFTPVPSEIQVTTAAGDLLVKRRSE